MEHLTENIKTKLTLLPKPLTICTSVDSSDQAQTNSKDLKHANEKETKLDTNDLNMQRKYNPNDTRSHEHSISQTSEILHSLNESETIDEHTIKQKNNKAGLYLEIVNNQINFMEEQEKMKNIITSLSLKMDTLDLRQSLEPVLSSVVKNVIYQSQKKIDIDPLLKSQKTISDIVRNSDSKEVYKNLFTEIFIASLSPTVDLILKEIIIDRFIPTIKYTSNFLFKYFDDAITDLLLEYQNAVFTGKVYFEIERIFNKFRSKLCIIIEKFKQKLSIDQMDVEKQFSSQIQNMLLPYIQSKIIYSKDVVNQYIIISDLLSHGDSMTALEKALSTSCVELVIYVCGEVRPEKIFQLPTLETSFVLSLIQLLSTNLTFCTKLKLEYMEAALGSLDYTNKDHKDNVHSVLVKVDLTIEEFILKYSNNYYSCKFKILQLAIKMIIASNK